MTRDDVPGVVLAVAVGAGLLWNLLGTHALGGMIGVGGGLVGVCLWAAVTTVCAVGVPAWWWSPVRVPTPRMRWALSGPADRGPALRGTLLRAVGVFVACGAAAGSVVGALTRSSSGLLAVGLGSASGAVAAALVVAVAGAAQMRRSGRASTAGSLIRPIGRWHRDVASPADGLTATARLLLVTADTEFVEHTRRVRWCARRPGARRRQVVDSSVIRTLVRADLIRLRRRPDDLAAWTAITAVTVTLGLTTTMHAAAPAAAALLAYRAGSAVSSGLRALTTTPALRRALRVAGGQIMLSHSIIPAAAVVVWAVPAALTVGGVSPVAWVVIVLGAIAATVRRATRPELPWDAPVYVTGQGGVAQPLLMLAMMRGHLAVVVVAVAACLV